MGIQKPLAFMRDGDLVYCDMVTGQCENRMVLVGDRCSSSCKYICENVHTYKYVPPLHNLAIFTFYFTVQCFSLCSVSILQFYKPQCTELDLIYLVVYVLVLIVSTIHHLVCQEIRDKSHTNKQKISNNSSVDFHSDRYCSFGSCIDKRNTAFW